MKPTRVLCSIVVALVAAFIPDNYSVFAQAPTQNGAGSEGAVKEAGRSAAIKEPEISYRAPPNPALRNANPAAVAIIGFVPRDILTSGVEAEKAEARYFSTGLSAPDAGRKRSQGDDDDVALAKKLRNPVSALARISFENNLDFGLAANREGYRCTMNLEPVIPFKLNENWNLISRTEMFVIQQDGVVSSTMQTGFGDILQNFFLSPVSTEPFFWGAGAVMLIPTATDTRLGSGKFGLGPAVAAGKQQGSWTYGAMARQIWSVAGHSDRADVRSTFIQPFVSYTTRSAWTFSLDTESSYDWVSRRWSVPIHVEAARIVRFGGHPVSVGGAVTCWAATPPGGPQACGVRFTITPLFPAR